MAHLFSPLVVANTELSNRIVMAPITSSLATSDGFVNDALISYYSQRAQGGVGLIITEAAHVVQPMPDSVRAHIGLYDDVFISQLYKLSRAVHSAGARLIIMLDEPAPKTMWHTNDLQDLVSRFIRAAWRVYAAECDGIMLSATDGGILHSVLSPLLNHRSDIYSGALDGRLRLSLEIIEGISAWLGSRLILGFRIMAEEFVPGGLSLHDARVIAKRVVAAGVNMLDVIADPRPDASVARFPGWCVPLANSVKRIIPDIPVICSGLMGDPRLSDSVIRDGSIDLVMLGQTLRDHPDWSHTAYALLLKSADEVQQATSATTIIKIDT